MRRFLIAVAILSLLLFPVLSSAQEQPGEIFAYKAKKIPKIDGKIEGREWDDAQPYYFEMKTNKYILNGTFKMTIALKHDSENLYILAIANDDDYDDGDFVFFNIHYHPQVNPNWTWETTLLFCANNTVMKGWMTKSGPIPKYFIDAKISVSYHINIGGNYYIFEAGINMKKYIPRGNQFVVGYFDEHYHHKEHIAYCDLYDLFYIGKYAISQSYYTGNESVEDVFKEHYPHANYFYLIALGIATVAIIASIIAIMRRRRRE